MSWNTEENIRCALAFVCPVQWEAMEPTARADVRLCSHCRSEVYEARSEEELRRLSAEGRCVAVRPRRAPDDQRPDLPPPPRMAGVPMPPSFFARPSSDDDAKG